MAVGQTLSFTVGRVRVTSASHPSEAGYIRSMRLQMEQIEKIIMGAIANIEGATPGAIRYALQPIYDRSQELVPVKTGKLKRSGFLEVQTESRSGRVRAAVGYGKHGRPLYAAFVHEMVHIPHAKGTQAKFLETAVNEKIGVFKRRLVRHLAENAGWGR